MTGLALIDVTARYGRGEAALDRVHLAIGAGEVVSVLGANGAGKSTLVGVVAGLHSTEGGTVRVAGVDMQRHPARARRHLGFAGQDVGLYPTETLRDNLRLFGSLAGLRGRSLGSEVQRVAEALGIAGSLDRRADHCSAGQRRRAHVAAALLHQPAVVVLDEPAAHLDPSGRHDLVRTARAASRRGAAVCWCTNDPDEAALVADRVTILDDGRMLVEGRPEELAQRLAPAMVEVAFDGSPPPVPHPRGGEVSGPLLRLVVSDAGTAMSEALATIGDHIDRVRSIRIVEPTLASAFSAVTGSRPDGHASRTPAAEVST